MFNTPAHNVVIGSETLWTVHGGTNFWSDYSDNYLIETTLSPADSKALKIDKEKISTTRFDLRLKCLAVDVNKGSSISVEMKQSSKLCRNLLRPAQHTIKFDIDC